MKSLHFGNSSVLSTNFLTAGQQLDAIAVRMLKERIVVATANARRSIEAPEKLVDHLLDQYRLSLHFLTAQPPRRDVLLLAIDRQCPVLRKSLGRLNAIVAGVIESGIRDSHFKARDRRQSTARFMVQTNPIWGPAAVLARLQKSECYNPYEHARAAVDQLIRT